MFRSTIVAAALASGLAGGVMDRAQAQSSSGSTAGAGAATTAGTLTPNSSNEASAASAARGPAKGANSFTEDQAQTRIAKAGYSDVAALTKDADGVWRGTAMKGGQQIKVWLDYKGDVGQQ